MPQFMIIGLVGGLASAALFASAVAGRPGGALVLYYLAPLPSLIAGIGWGWFAAAVAALAGALGIAVTLTSAKLAGAFFISQGLPIVVIAYLALLSRPAADGNGAVEWYPIGRLVAAATIIAGLIGVATLLTLGTDVEEIRALMKKIIEEVFSKDLERLRGTPLTGAQIDSLTGLMLYVLPGASASSWLASFLLNLWLAGRITQASGRLARPWPDLGLMTFPRPFPLFLAAATVLTFVPGYFGLIAISFSGALVFAYMLLGLAIIHYVTRDNPQRPFVLSAVYAVLLVLNTWAAIGLALVGLAEPVSPLNRFRRKPKAPPPGG